eukprot:COSAG02_NODE_5156_length_4583_cov_2.229706_3_plen_51_part_00
MDQLGMLLGTKLWYPFFGEAIETTEAFNAQVRSVLDRDCHRCISNDFQIA